MILPREVLVLEERLKRRLVGETSKEINRGGKDERKAVAEQTGRGIAFSYAVRGLAESST